MAWDKVLNAKEGGLESAAYAPITLRLAKCWWRFKTENDALWRQVIISLHDSYGNLKKSMNNDGGKGTREHIATLNKDVDKSNIHLDNLFQRSLGDDSKIMFWKEKCCGADTLEERFPMLAALDASINCSVMDMIELRVQIARSIFLGNGEEG